MKKLIRRRDFLKVSLVGVIAIILIGFGTWGVFGQENVVFLKIAAGTPGTSYYAFSGPMGSLINQYSKNPKISTTVSTSGGGLANMRLLEAGETDIATCIANVVHQAYNGIVSFKKKVDIRNILMAEALPYYFVVLADSKYKTVGDLLKGAKITPGDQAGGTHQLFRDVMKVLGYSYSESNLVYMAFGECKDAIADKKVDAWWTFQSANVDALVSFTKVRFITFTDSELKKILDATPFLSKGTVPAEAYGRNIPEAPFPALVATSLWVCKPDMDPNIVYQIVKIVCENKEVVQKSQASSRVFDAKFAASSKTASYHEGAIRYYKEVGAM